MQTQPDQGTTAVVSEANYDALRADMKKRVEAMANQPLVIAAIDAKALFLAAMPNAEVRQHYNCSACKRFLESHGGLAVVHPDGTLESALFPVPGHYGELDEPIRVIREAIASAVVRKGPTQERLAGRTATTDTKRQKTWSHLHAVGLVVPLPPHEARDRFVMFQRGLLDFPTETLLEAHKLLTSGNLSQSERHAEMCGWLLDLSRKCDASDRRLERNILWRAAVTCPPGYANFRGGALGALLDDVKAGKEFATIKRRFETVMDPLKYMRQQSVSKGQLEAAEKRIAELGYAPSLRRRMATLADLQPFWTPPASETEPAKGSGVFGHVKTTGGPEPQRAIEQPAIAITWSKFERDVLPTAKAITVDAPGHGGYYQFTTAVVSDSPNIHQWDNRVAFYTYNGGAHATSFGITAGHQPVVALVRAPHEWSGQPLTNHPKAVFLVIAGCGDKKTGQGCGIFPSNLKSDLHGVRAAIEAYSHQTEFEPQAEQPAGGLRFGEGYAIRVKVDGQGYVLDRWE